jgi:magnesium transporter
MNTIYLHRDGRTDQVTSIDRTWLSPAAGVYIWVDLASPSIPESLVLSDTFAFHRLAMDDALASSQLPKIEAYDGYLFAGVAGSDADFGVFVGPHYMITVHWNESKAITDLSDSVKHGGKIFAEGPVAMFHRLLTAAGDGFGLNVDELTKQTARIEELLKKPNVDVVVEMLQARRDVFHLQQRLSRQRDAVRGLARREVVEISEEMSFRFRDAYSRLSRLTDDALALDRRLADTMTVLGGAGGKRSWM